MRFIRPEYAFRPSQIIRRVAYFLGITRNLGSAMLPWGVPIKFDPHELHGRAVLTLGLSDLRTNEMISRIVREGDISVDIGANIGVMTSLMARRAGSSGQIFAFEPHPSTRILLGENTKIWSQCLASSAEVNVLSFAVSSESGRATLRAPRNFYENSGLASLEVPSTDTEESSIQISVETVAFDCWARDIKAVRLVKIDVEGHEDHVLSGMECSLRSKKIDFLIFEEFRPLPSPATMYLERFGYKCFLIDRSFWGPSLREVSDRPAKLVGETTNVLALHRLDDFTALTRRGWSCLR